jgi:hypothetical protein
MPELASALETNPRAGGGGEGGGEGMRGFEGGAMIAKRRECVE